MRICLIFRKVRRVWCHLVQLDLPVNKCGHVWHKCSLKLSLCYIYIYLLFIFSPNVKAIHDRRNESCSMPVPYVVTVYSVKLHLIRLTWSFIGVFFPLGHQWFASCSVGALCYEQWVDPL